MSRQTLDFLQGGTCKHIDSDITNPSDPRPFQAFVALSDVMEGDDDEKDDGTLKIVPGFHHFAERYFRLCNSSPPGGYFPLDEGIHPELVKSDDWWLTVRRIRQSWNPDENELEMPCHKHRRWSKPEIFKQLQETRRDFVENAAGDAVKEGDYVLWDPRMIHTTGEHEDWNTTEQPRMVFYCSFMRITGNESICAEQLSSRSDKQHPQWAPSSHKLVESVTDGYDTWVELAPLTELGSELYCGGGMVPMKRRRSSLDADGNRRRSIQQAALAEDSDQVRVAVTVREIAFMRRYGFVVLPGLVPTTHTRVLKQQIWDFIGRRMKVDLDANDTCQLNELMRNAMTLTVMRKLFSGSGMFEVYWLPEMDTIRQLPVLVGSFRSLYRHTWGTGKGCYAVKGHPKMASVPSLGIYVDRVNIRLPTTVISSIMKREQEKEKQ